MVRAPEDWRKTLRHAEALVRRRDRRAFDLLIPALRWRYDTARGRAVALLAKIGPEAVPCLFERVDHAETAVERRSAMDALGLIRDSRAVPRLIRGLEDPAMSVRRSAMVALLRLEAMSAVPRVIRGLRDESGGVRVLAATVLGRFEDPRAVPALVQSLRDPQWYVRQHAAVACGALGIRAGAEKLRAAETDARKAVREAAARALDQLARRLRR